METFQNLTILDVRNNALLIDANYGVCTHNTLLTDLNLEGNNLSKTANLKTFGFNCNRLKYLRLAFNNLSHDHLKVINLTGTEYLILLDLSHNNIRNLPHHFHYQINVKVNPNLKKLNIDLTGNNLACNCGSEICTPE